MVKKSAPESSEGSITLKDEPSTDSKNGIVRWGLTVWEHKVEFGIWNSLLQKDGKKYCYKKEACPDTGKLHWHIYVELKKKQRLSYWNTQLGKGFGDAKLVYEPIKWIKYICKEDTAVEKPVFVRMCKPYMGEDLPKLENLFWWQKDILKTMEKPWEDRIVYWYWSTKGGLGKSRFGKYLAYHHNARYITCEKSADILTGVSEEYRTYVLDFPKSVGAWFAPWGALEQLKNGHITEAKCKGKLNEVKCLPPHVFVFSNFEPDLDMMTEKRFIIVNIEEKKIEVKKEVKKTKKGMWIEI